MKNIIAGIWLGEFGWELMRWQGIFRNIKYNNPKIKITIVGKPGHNILYEDYADEYIELQIDNLKETDGWRVNGETPNIPENILSLYPDYLYMDPSSCMRPYMQQIIKYGIEEYGHPDILIHPRNTSKCETSYRNWPLENWIQLIERLQNKNYSIGVIGTDQPLLQHINDLKLLYNKPLRELVNIMASSKLVLGPSSGPMHLASLCGAPHLVWTNNQYWSSCSGTNRYRYEVSWNPLGTKTIILDDDNWQPSVEKVFNSTIEFLNG